LYFNEEIKLKMIAFLNNEEVQTASLNSLGSDLDVLFKDGFLPDIKVVAGQTEFPCHKIILASRSDVFKAMFSHSNVNAP
jgi:hypothetical protein